MAHSRTIKVILFFSVLVGMVGWKLFGSGPLQANAGVETKQANNLQVVIQDPLILKAWNTLNSLEEPVVLWDGKALTGKALAQFLLAEQIPVVWGSDDICKGSSCSRLYCAADGACAYDDGQPGVDPIYLNPGARDQQAGQNARVARELAHEAFHRLQPFGQVNITQFEEYWAFYLETQVLKASYPDFKGCDPTDASSLQKWFTKHMMAGYLKLDVYPNSILLH